MKRGSTLERRFSLIWTKACTGAPKMIPEFKFHPKRRWRFDFANPLLMVAIEIEGGIWNGGRHTTGRGFIADCEKYNEALKLGWKVMRLTKSQLTVPYLQGLIQWMNSLE